MRVPVESRDAADAVRTSVEIAASPDVVFHALTDHRELAAWLAGDAESANESAHSLEGPSLPIPGQPWSAPALAPDGALGSVCGEFLRVDPPCRLETTWRASWDDFAPDRVRFELTPIDVGGTIGTRVTVTHTRAHTRARARLQITARATASGRDEWPAMLWRLVSYLTPPVAVSRPGELHPPASTYWYGDIVDLTTRAPFATRRPS